MDSQDPHEHELVRRCRCRKASRVNAWRVTLWHGSAGVVSSGLVWLVLVRSVVAGESWLRDARTGKTMRAGARQVLARCCRQGPEPRSKASRVEQGLVNAAFGRLVECRRGPFRLAGVAQVGRGVDCLGGLGMVRIGRRGNSGSAEVGHGENRQASRVEASRTSQVEAQTGRHHLSQNGVDWTVKVSRGTAG
jgi:hypothetical protein